MADGEEHSSAVDIENRLKEKLSATHLVHSVNIRCANNVHRTMSGCCLNLRGAKDSEEEHDWACRAFHCFQCHNGFWS